MSSDESNAVSVFRSGGAVGRFAVIAIITWVIVEVVLRRGGVRVLADVVESARGADVILIGVGFPLLAYGLARWGMRRGITASDWDYDVSVRSVGLGLASAILYFVVFVAITIGYTQIVGTPQSAAANAALVENASETLWLAVGFFLVNGILVPITEELAWRGVIQTSLMESYGTYAGVTITAIAFVLKHVIVDAAAPFLRVISLLLLAFLFCGLRARYGTASSTVAHLATNSIASVGVVFAAL
jgi:membrane protease YdiL (CAAX protease family)